MTYCSITVLAGHTQPELVAVGIIPIYGDAAVFSPAGFLDSRFRGNDGRGSYDAYAFG